MDSYLQTLRRIHAIEHATIHLLSRRFPHRTFVGHSDRSGFIIIGETSSDEVRKAAESALTRLQHGEASLAYHPNCGTNLVVTGLLVGTTSFLTTISFRETSWRRRLEQLPTVVLAATTALVAARPLAALAQRHLTTDPDPGNLRVHDVEAVSFAGTAAFRVHVRA